MKIRKILALTDLSTASRAGLKLASALAERTGGVVDIGHVSRPIPGPTPEGEADVVARVESMMRAEEEEVLKDEATSDVAAATLGEIHRIQGECVRCGIRDLIAHSQADLVCLGARGREAMPGLLVGSIAEFTARAAGVPVLIARDGELPAQGESLKLMLATDLVEPPAASVARLGGLLTSADELILAHVVETPVYYPRALGIHPALDPAQLAALKKAATSVLTDVDLGSRQPRTTVRVAEGRAGETLVRLAEELRPHILAARTHATRAYDPTLLGPVCEYLVRRCPVPLLVIPRDA